MVSTCTQPDCFSFETYTEELSELLALLFGVWWVPGNVGWLSVEEVRHEDLVFTLLVPIGKDVGT